MQRKNRPMKNSRGNSPIVQFPLGLLFHLLPQHHHAASALVDAGGHRDIGVRDVECGVIRDERCGMAVRAETQVDEIDDGRFAAEFFEFGLILFRGEIQIGLLDGHRVNVRGIDRRVFQ